MAGNRQQRRSKKKSRTSDHNMVRQLAKARTLQGMAMRMDSDRRAQRLLWIVVVAANEVFGIGKDRVNPFMK